MRLFRTARRLAQTALALAGVGAGVIGGPGATASASADVRPGTYRILNGSGQCLRGTGEVNAHVPVGACDTRWNLEAAGKGFTVRHAATGNCLTTSLLLIYPPYTATRGCAVAEIIWTIRAEGDDRVFLSLGGPAATLTDLGRASTVLLNEGAEPREKQLWILKR